MTSWELLQTNRVKRDHVSHLELLLRGVRIYAILFICVFVEN